MHTPNIPIEMEKQMAEFSSSKAPAGRGKKKQKDSLGLTLAKYGTMLGVAAVIFGVAWFFFIR